MARISPRRLAQQTINLDMYLPDFLLHVFLINLHTILPWAGDGGGGVRLMAALFGENGGFFFSEPVYWYHRLLSARDVLALITVIIWVVRYYLDGCDLLDLPPSVPFYIGIDRTLSL
jgi:hypothetical protein